MNYLQAENLKHRRTFVKKLLFLAPLTTMSINLLSISWYQINSYNWWYVFLCPGFLTLICSIIEQRDNGKLRYQAILPMPISLDKVWNAKIGIAAIYFLVGNLIFLMFNLSGGFVIHILYGKPLALSILRALAGTTCIVLVSLWQIPLCLWLSKKWGIFATIILNCGLGSMLGILAAKSSLWFICPYGWVPYLMITVLRIMPNGVPVTTQDVGLPIPMIFLVVLISLVWFGFLSLCTAESFKKQGVK